jgi:hypothetical protein
MQRLNTELGGLNAVALYFFGMKSTRNQQSAAENTYSTVTNRAQSSPLNCPMSLTITGIDDGNFGLSDEELWGIVILEFGIINFSGRCRNWFQLC